MAQGYLEEALSCFERAKALDPNDDWCYGLESFCLTFLGRPEEALVAVDMALKLDPFGKEWFWEGRGMALMVAGRNQEALDDFQRMIDPPSWILVWQAICRARLNQLEHARALFEQYMAIEPETTVSLFMADDPFVDDAIKDCLRSTLVEIGMPE
jgi:tetratricopeptide (TPR) repeat protein